MFAACVKFLNALLLYRFKNRSCSACHSAVNKPFLFCCSLSENVVLLKRLKLFVELISTALVKTIQDYQLVESSHLLVDESKSYSAKQLQKRL